MKKRIRKLFVRIFARKLFQSFFKKLHWLSLRGMNYGGGHSPHDSGELHFLNYVKKKSGEEIIVLDVGANIGQYATLVNRVFNSKSTIYSFEPVKFTFSCLEKNTEKLGNVIPVNKGVSEFSGKTEIFYEGKGSVQSSIIQDDISKHSEIIELTTVDEFCKDNQIKKVDLLKLDIEGSEYNALRGATKAINNIDYIQFEFGNMQVLSRHFITDFIKILDNFKIYRLIQDGFIEIDSNPINEIFQTSNYIAINKSKF